MNPSSAHHSLSNYSRSQLAPRDYLSWLDALRSQEHGLDPLVYSDPHNSPRPSASPCDLPQDLPPHMFPSASSSLWTQTQFDGSSSACQQQFFAYPPLDLPYGTGIEKEEDWSTISSSSSPPSTDFESPAPDDSRRKSTIALDPSQPLTVEGKPRERVFVACDRCRLRKLRCDGAKPSCYNCQRATEPNVQCRYQAMPKRRGQDKAPRIRSPIGQRKPRKSAVRKEQDVDPTDQFSGFRPRPLEHICP